MRKVQDARQFQGWIPNVTGRLSFSHFGDSNHPGPCKTLNEDDGDVRVVYVDQKRRLSDSPLPDGYFRWLYGYDPRWVFVLLARSAEDRHDHMGVLEGQVYCFMSQQWRHQNDILTPGGLTTAFLNAVTGDPQTIFRPTKEEPVQRFLEIEPELKRELEQQCIYSASCKIFRNGKVFLTPELLHDDLEFSPSPLPEAARESSIDLFHLVSQAYFFLKDIGHHHRHHAKKSDSITSVSEADKRDSWIRETHYNIHKRLVQLRRSKNQRDLYDALGMLAYLQSFSNVVKSIKKSSETKQIVESYTNKEFEDSIKATIEVNRWRRTQLNILVVALPALTIALGAFLRPSEFHEPSNFFTAARSLLQEVFDYSIFGLLAFIVFAFTCATLYSVIHPLESPLFLNVKRMLVVLKKRHQTRWYLGFALLYFLAFCCYLGLYFSSQTHPMFAGGWDFRLIGWIAVAIGAALPLVVVTLIPLVVSIPDAVRRISRDLQAGWRKLVRKTG